MGTNAGTNTGGKVDQSLRARKWSQNKNRILCALGVFVTIGVAYALMQSVMAAKSKDKVLDCHVVETVAHHHTTACYDDSGELVCTLPERDLHTHSASCYEKKLVCTTPEGEGHKHSDECYDEDGNLTCELEESEAHEHTDECYKDVLVCDKLECTEEHVHSDSCFHVIKTDDDAEQTPEPEKSFTKTLEDEDGNFVLTVDVNAPEGALPEGTTMEAKPVQNDEVDKDILQKAVDDKAARLETLEPGKVLDFRAVDITFRDSEGISIEPKADVTVKLTSALAAADDQAVVLHLSDKKDGQDKITAEVVDTLSEKQMSRRGSTLGTSQVAFDAHSFSTYVIATVSKAGELKAGGGTSASVTLTAPAEAGIPADATLTVNEIAKTEKDYDSYLDRTAEATEIDKEDVGLARFFDITIADADGNEIQPQAPVDVKIELKGIPEDPTDFKLVHFAEDEDGEQAEAPEEVTAGGENGTTTFTAESFSVYGIVYTVDFGYQVGDQVFEYKLDGGTSMGVSELVDKLHIYEDAPEKYNSVEKFTQSIDKVEFTDTSLVYVKKIEDKTRVKDVMEQEQLTLDFSACLSEDDYNEAVAKEYENEWVLFSLQPFTTNEMLTITMADASKYYVKVTDNWDRDVPHKGNSNVADSIANPGGTTIDLFDYWVRDTASPDTSHKRGGWPGYTGNPEVRNDWSFSENGGLRGTGTNSGINRGHDLKFTPGAERTVRTSKGNVNSDSANPRRLNDYMGNATPVQGIIENRLSGGYPYLKDSNEAAGESLAYLFDDSSQAGKKKYSNVNHLLYKQTSDGYYTYDSRDVRATFVESNATAGSDGYFELHQQYQGQVDQEAIGFWPFHATNLSNPREVDNNWWLGLHAQVNFLQPKNGMILDDQGNPTKMKFEFSGDDDAWVFIDGVLVGDGGGIHNRTEIDIDFSTGQVIVTGENDNVHRGSKVTDTTLYEIFRQANALDVPEGGWNGNTFADNSKHIFDFFYLERGGSESNLYLHYNLQAITDFYARKDYYDEEGTNYQGDLKKDQFKFTLLGSNGLIMYNKDTTTGDPVKIDDTHLQDPVGIDNTTDYKYAIMPLGQSGRSGTFDDPTLDPVSIDLNSGDPNNPVHIEGMAYTTGNDSSGNVLFGEAIIKNELIDYINEHHDAVYAYRYVVTEVVPDDAVNAYGKQYQYCTLAEKEAGGFYKDGVHYEEYTYFMEIWLTSNGTEVTQKRVFYEDKLFKKLDEDSSKMYLQFQNEHYAPMKLKVHKIDSKTQQALAGAEFQYGYATQDAQTSAWSFTNASANQTKTTDTSGNATFDAMPPGFYLLKETKVPANYKEPDCMWVVKLEGVSADAVTQDPTKLTITPYIKKINLDGTEIQGEDFVKIDTIDIAAHTATTDIENEPMDNFKLKVQKQWQDIDSDDSALANTELNVTLGRYTLSKRFATINIVKKGMPVGASILHNYTVYRLEPDPNDPSNPIRHTLGTYSRQDWDGTELIATLTVPVEDGGTDYLVEEMRFGQPSGYVVVHTPDNTDPGGFPGLGYIQQHVNEGTTVDFEFNATYTEVKEHVLVVGELHDERTDTSTPIDTSNVEYVLIDTHGNELATKSYDDVAAAGASGYDFGEYRLDLYGVAVRGWPDVQGAGHSSDPVSYTSGYDGLTFVTLREGQGPATAHLRTDYVDKGKCTLTVIAHKRGDIDTYVTLSEEEVFVGTQQKVSFNVAPGDTDYTDDDRNRWNDAVTVGNQWDRMDYIIDWDGSVPDGSDPTTPCGASVTVSIPEYATHMYLVINLRDVEATEAALTAAVTDVDISSVTTRGGGQRSLNAKLTGDGKGSEGILNELQAKNELQEQLDASKSASDEPTVTMTESGSTANTVIKSEELSDLLSNAGAAKGLAAAGLRASNPNIQPGTYGQVLSWTAAAGPGEPPTAGKDEAYVPDDDFIAWSAAHPITLTQSVNDDGNGMWKWETDDTNRDQYPAYNSKGEKYYYYILNVEELNLPAGTTGEILTDPTDDTKQRLAYYIEPDPATPTVIPDTTPLAFKNKVASPVDVTIIKVDQNNSNTKLEGAKFHLQKKNGQAWETVLTPDIEAVVDTETFTLDNATGIFSVPKNGVKIKGLMLGNYKIVEDECPPGYVMNTTEWTFDVTQTGTLDNVDSKIIYDSDKAPTALLIPNPPGSELPHAGGNGTTLFSAVGAALMAAGATLLLRRRREA